MRSFVTRLLVALIAIPALLFLFHRGGEWLRVLVLVLIVLGMIEAQRLTTKAGAPYALIPSILLAVLIPWMTRGVLAGLSWPVWMSLAVIVAAVSVVRPADVRTAAVGAAAQVVTIVWVAIGLGALLALREFADGQGFWWLMLLFANLWIGDTAAYLFGVWLGKAKLAPLVSPRKTIAGAVAQVLASAAVGFAFAAAGWIEATTGLLVAASLIIGVVGQLGDLFESVLKRAAGEKDSSALIPGHGGVLDRFDSAMFAAPSLYAMLTVWPR